MADDYEADPIDKKWPKITSNYKVCHISETHHLAYPGTDDNKNVVYFFRIKTHFEKDPFELVIAKDEKMED